MFDSSVGANTILWPFGGKHQLTPPDAMVAKLPVLEGETDHATYMAWGFDPHLSEKSPFHGAAYAVTESVCKAVAAGARLSDIRLTLQEYFPKLGQDPKRWGLPFAALLGAFRAQHELRLAAIGGKDSMSGSFNDLDVPPTLVSFALAPGLASLALSPEFKKAGSTVSIVETPILANGLPDFAALKQTAEALHNLNKAGKILSLHHIGKPGLAAALSKSCLINIPFIESATTSFSFVNPFLMAHSAPPFMVINVLPACTHALILSTVLLSNKVYIPDTMIIVLYLLKSALPMFKMSILVMGMSNRWSNKCQISPASDAATPVPISISASVFFKVRLYGLPKSGPPALNPDPTLCTLIEVDALALLTASNS
jgi:hypothetical protein